MWLDMTPIGFPHSDIYGSKLARQLPVAYRSLLRPSSVYCVKASFVCAWVTFYEIVVIKRWLLLIVQLTSYCWSRDKPDGFSRHAGKMKYISSGFFFPLLGESSTITFCVSDEKLETHAVCLICKACLSHKLYRRKFSISSLYLNC